jgi:hypothetical protein
MARPTDRRSEKGNILHVRPIGGQRKGKNSTSFQIGCSFEDLQPFTLICRTSQGTKKHFRERFREHFREHFRERFR